MTETNYIEKALEKCNFSVKKLSQKTGLTERYLIGIKNKEKKPGSHTVKMLEHLSKGKDIDKSKYYISNTEQQKEIINIAISKLGSMSCLCKEAGLHRSYLSKLKNGTQTWSYQVQLTIERIAFTM